MLTICGYMWEAILFEKQLYVVLIILLMESLLERKKRIWTACM